MAPLTVLVLVQTIGPWSGTAGLRFQGLRAFQAEFGSARILRIARSASARERGRAFHAEFRSVRIFSSALRAAHCGFPEWLARRFRLSPFQRASQRLYEGQVQRYPAACEYLKSGLSEVDREAEALRERL